MDARVVIPTWNAGPQLAQLLACLRSQEPAGIVREIVVMDSSSTDGSAELARRSGAIVIPIAKATFNHGGTRAQGASGACTEAIVFLVQDALPVGSEFVASLLAPLRNESVAATYARVESREDASALVKLDVSRDLVAGRTRLRKKIDNREDYERWSPHERRVFCHFNNVASAIRTSVFLELPFRPLAFGEDLDFGKRALEAGHTIEFVPDAVVRHSHTSGLRRDFERHRQDAAVEFALFGIRKPRSLLGALSRAARLCLRDITGTPPVSAPFLRLSQSLGRWRGASDSTHLR